MTLLPGRARLLTRPAATASPTTATTMGIVAVAAFAALAPTAVWVTMTSTFRPTSSAASSGNRSYLLSAKRYSMTILFPSTSACLKGCQQRKWSGLFDHLGGAHEERRRDREAKRFGGSHVDDEVEARGTLKR